jgi:CubicO group peptidase (beta-lactamase class C family)
MRKLLFLILIFASTKFASAQSLYFPPLIGTSWDTINPSSLGWCQPKIDSLYDYLEQTNSKSFILLKDGKIVLEKYFGTHTRDSLWYWASAGKTLTAFTVGIAQQEGFLSINDTSSNYLGTGWTVCPQIKEEKITIRNQLTMTSGLDDGVPDHYCTLDTCLQFLANAGTRWAYHNGPYTLLDGVISNATGQSLNSYFNTKVRSRIGMNGTFFQVGYNNVYFSNARSMARFGLLMLNQGNWNGTQIMTDTAYFNQMINTSQNLNLSYGYLWWLNGKSSFMAPTFQTVFPGPLFADAPSDMYAALGKDGQIINVVPSENLIFIRMGEAPGTSSEVTPVYNNDIWKKLNDLSCTTAVTEIEQKSKLSVFPNPAKGQVQIWSSSNIDRLELYNLSGQLLFEMTNLNSDEYLLDIYNFDSGVYIIKTINKEEISISKMLIEK